MVGVHVKWAELSRSSDTRQTGYLDRDTRFLQGAPSRENLNTRVDYLFILLQPPGMFKLSSHPPPESRQDVFSSIVWADGDMKMADMKRSLLADTVSLFPVAASQFIIVNFYHFTKLEF